MDLGAAGVALVAFLLLPFAFVGDMRSGLGWLMAGRWAFALPVLVSLAVAFLARQGVTTAGMRLALAGGGLFWMILYGFHGN